MKNARLNWHAIFFSILYTAFAVAGFSLIITKSYQRFVTPKSVKYLLFMSIVCLLFAVVEMLRIKRPGAFSKVGMSIVYLLPLALLCYPNLSVDGNYLGTGFLSDPSASSNLVANGNTGYQGNVYRGESMNFTIEEEKTPSLTERNSSNSFARPVDLKGLDQTKRTIDIDDEQFYDWITEIFANADQYVGYTVSVKGKLFHSDDFMGPNQFVPSRLLMTCCAADAIPCGLIANVADLNTVALGSWATVTGTLSIGDYNGQRGPVLDVIEMTPSTAPEYEYVYPK